MRSLQTGFTGFTGFTTQFALDSLHHPPYQYVMASPTAIKTYVACAAVLYFKFVAVTSIQANKTFEAGGRPPEDKDLPQARGQPVQTYGLAPTDDKNEKMLKAKAVELRWRRIVQNDVESIPLALAIFGAGLLVSTSTGVQVGAMITYTASRCAHTVVYANALHPWRALSWTVGVLAITTGACNALYGAFLA